MNRNEFLELPQIQKWQKACSNNPTQFGVYLNKLLIICNTTKLSVSELLTTDNHLFRMIEVYNDFKQKVSEGEIVHTRKTNDTPTNFTKYATSLKSFFGSQGFYIPPKFEFETRKGMPNYAEIELTDKERDQGLIHFGGLGDPNTYKPLLCNQRYFAEFRLY